MITRTRCLVTVAMCVVGLCASLSALNGAAAAGTKAPGVNGIWLAYAWATGQGKPSLDFSRDSGMKLPASAK